MFPEESGGRWKIIFLQLGWLSLWPQTWHCILVTYCPQIKELKRVCNCTKWCWLRFHLLCMNKSLICMCSSPGFWNFKLQKTSRWKMLLLLDWVFPHFRVCKSFLFYFITYKSSLFVPFVKMLFILIINWINWICAGKAGGKNVKMGCLPHSNWGDFVFSLLLVDLRLLRLHITPLPVRLRLWVHWRTVCVHGPKWKSHRGATRR